MGADLKDSGLFPVPAMGDPCQKPISREVGGLASQSPSPPLPPGRGVYREGGGRNTEIKGGAAKFSTCRRAQRIAIRRVTVVCVILAESPRLHVISAHVILVPRLKVSKCPGAGMPEGRSLYFEVSS